MKRASNSELYGAALVCHRRSTRDLAMWFV
jgi:hypothetical protein